MFRFKVNLNRGSITGSADWNRKENGHSRLLLRFPVPFAKNNQCLKVTNT